MRHPLTTTTANVLAHFLPIRFSKRTRVGVSTSLWLCCTCSVELCWLPSRPRTGIVSGHCHSLAPQIEILCSLAKNLWWLHHWLLDHVLQVSALVHPFPPVPCHRLPEYVAYTQVPWDCFSFPNHTLCPCRSLCPGEPSRLCCLTKPAIIFCPVTVVPPYL